MEAPIVLTEENFAEQLKNIRLAKNMTQKQLAEKARVTQQTISSIEKGKIDPSLKLLLTIAGILGISLLISSFLKNESNVVGIN